MLATVRYRAKSRGNGEDGLMRRYLAPTRQAGDVCHVVENKSTITTVVAHGHVSRRLGFSTTISIERL
jgi:hypothetical protein